MKGHHQWIGINVKCQLQKRRTSCRKECTQKSSSNTERLKWEGLCSVYYDNEHTYEPVVTEKDKTEETVVAEKVLNKDSSDPVTLNKEVESSEILISIMKKRFIIFITVENNKIRSMAKLKNLLMLNKFLNDPV